MTSNEDPALVDKLSRVSMFEGLDDSSLRAIAKLVLPFDAPAGHVLVHSGMVGSGLFLIEEGAVSLNVKGKDIELGPGEFFGELALLDERAVHTARVRARTDVRGYCIARDAFTKLLDDEPKLPLAMLRVLAHRLVDTLSS